MAIQAYMFVKGTKQGDIKGECVQQQGKDGFEILSLSHEVTMPVEARTGQVAGRRVHHPFTVEKVIDKGSPMLYKALTTGEQLSVEIRWMRPDPGGGQEQQYFTTKLGKAVLTSIKTEIPDIVDAEGRAGRHNEYLSFTYGEITWTDKVNGGETIDKWAEMSR